MFHVYLYVFFEDLVFFFTWTRVGIYGIPSDNFSSSIYILCSFFLPYVVWALLSPLILWFILINNVFHSILSRLFGVLG